MTEQDTVATETDISMDSPLSETPSEEPTPMEEFKEEYPQYTEANPMKLPVETSNDFVIGLDFGNTTSIVAVAKYGELSHQPYVLHNSLGDLSHHAIISFGDNRILGADAASQLILSPKETIFDLKYLNQHPQTKEDDVQYPFALIAKDQLYSGVNVKADFLENNEISFQQMIGALIGNFCSYAKRDSLYWQFREKILRQRIPRDVPVEKREVTGVDVTQCVVAVPACYSEQQRAAILDAGMIGGIEIVGLVDEGVASALTYTVSRRHELKQQRKENQEADQGDNFPETVVIADMGHSFFNLAIAKVGYNRMKVLHSSSLKIGGNTFQNNLTAHVTEMLKKKYSVEGDLSIRTKARLTRAIEKTMKVLSTVAQGHVEVENFQDGVDVRELITRAEFEAICGELLKEIGVHVAQAIRDAGLEPDSNLKVEIVGGGSRIPSVQSAIQQATGTAQLRFTLDSNNSVAVGAAVYGALVGFKGTYDLEDQTFEYIPLDENMEDVTAFRMSQEDLQKAIDAENRMRKRDEEIKQHQELRNDMEQFIYRYIEDVSTFSSQVPHEEITAVELELEKSKEWLLYSEESAQCSLEELIHRYDELKHNIATKAPTLQKMLEQREAERIKANEEAAEAEKNRTVTHRDKVKNPKTPRERVDAAIARKNQGNTFFKDLNYEHAVTRYLQAVNLLAEVPGEKFKEEIEQTKLSCHLNLAMCYLQLKKYNLATENCNMALRIDENNVKAYFRRGKSKYAVKQYEEAKKDFELAVEKDPSNAAAKKQVILCDKQIANQKQRERKMYAKMFS